MCHSGVWKCEEKGLTLSEPPALAALVLSNILPSRVSGAPGEVRGTSSMGKVTGQCHKTMTSLSALLQEKTQGSGDQGEGQVVLMAGDSDDSPGGVAQSPQGTRLPQSFVHSSLLSSHTHNISTLPLEFFTFLEERPAAARIKIECESHHRNPI